MTHPLTANSLSEAGVRHGFSTREGGVSRPPFDALNLARTVGDAPEAVAENHRRLAAAVGYAPERLFEVSQVHGARVVRVAAGDEPAALRREEADALVTDVPKTTLGVRVADCLPVLFADPEAGVIGAAHAGWRGVEAGVLAETVAAAVALGARPQRLRAALGVHIGPCCFEVGQEVAERIARAAPGAAAIVTGHAKPHVDLAAAAEAQLAALGLAPGHVARAAGCTYCDGNGRFFSYRAAQGHTGRLLAVVSLD